MKQTKVRTILGSRLPLLAAALIFSFVFFSFPKVNAACIAGETCGAGTNAAGSSASDQQTSTITSTYAACQKFLGDKASDDAKVRDCENTTPQKCLNMSRNTKAQETSFDNCVTKNSLQGNPIVKDLQTITNFLSALVGIVVIGAIIFGAIQYIMAGDNAGQVTAAKQRITNAVLALVVYFLIVGFLQWLIPGGLFG